MIFVRPMNQDFSIPCINACSFMLLTHETVWGLYMKYCFKQTNIWRGFISVNSTLPRNNRGVHKKESVFKFRKRYINSQLYINI